jgi:hypothetical protein
MFFAVSQGFVKAEPYPFRTRPLSFTDCAIAFRIEEHFFKNKINFRKSYLVQLLFLSPNFDSP